MIYRKLIIIFILFSCNNVCEETKFIIFSNSNNFNKECLNSNKFSWVLEDVPILQKNEMDSIFDIKYKTYFQFSSYKDKNPLYILWTFDCKDLNSFNKILKSKQMNLDIEKFISREQRMGELLDLNGNSFKFDIGYSDNNEYEVTISYEYKE
jgi:hypothetical protein